ncbi:hypothetical protein D9M69_732110 [compost metagenome]
MGIKPLGQAGDLSTREVGNECTVCNVDVVEAFELPHPLRQGEAKRVSTHMKAVSDRAFEVAQRAGGQFPFPVLADDHVDVPPREHAVGRLL